MNTVFWILVGVVIGWLIEWVIDWLFWRKDDSQLQEKLNQAEAELEQLKAQPMDGKLQNELAELKQEFASTQQEINTCRSRLADADQTIQALRAELNELRPARMPEPEDQLEDIKGIGTVFARKLKAAGITTFEQLARTPAERIREIIQPQEWQKIEPEAWIIEAKAMAAQKEAKTAR
jgi:predicted flap endonuclease-1-like 5' DNA nuclease